MVWPGPPQGDLQARPEMTSCLPQPPLHPRGLEDSLLECLHFWLPHWLPGAYPFLGGLGKGIELAHSG